MEKKIWAFVIIYICLVCAFLGFYVQNLSTTYTWFANLGAPGSQLVSFRGTFVDVTIRLVIVSHIFTPAIIFLIYLYPFKILYAIYVICTTLTLLAIAGTGSAYSGCNTYFGNICNDLLYCCKYPGGGCPTVIPCPSALTLGPNETFLGLFWINFVLFLMQLTFTVYKGYEYWKEGNPPKEEVKEEEKKEVEEPPNAPIIPNAPVNAKLHGLRKLKI